MSRRKRILIIAPLALLAMAAFLVIGGEVVRLLWNWLLPGLFGWRQIGFWQALGLLALCRILFGGLGIRGSGSMRGRMSERWNSMTPEEREQLRRRMCERWGFGPAPSEKTS